MWLVLYSIAQTTSSKVFHSRTIASRSLLRSASTVPAYYPVSTCYPVSSSQTPPCYPVSTCYPVSSSQTPPCYPVFTLLSSLHPAIQSPPCNCYPVSSSQPPCTLLSNTPPPYCLVSSSQHPPNCPVSILPIDLRTCFIQS